MALVFPSRGTIKVSKPCVTRGAKNAKKKRHKTKASGGGGGVGGGIVGDSGEEGVLLLM